MTQNQNMLMVSGMVPLSTTDFPDELAAVVFCQGCPWRCHYCHNPHLHARSSDVPLIWSDILDFLRQRVDLLDAVVFSGGEPTMQHSLVEAVRQVKQMGFRVGLHTAGCFPDVVREIVQMLDWVGLDIKALPSDYAFTTRVAESHLPAYTTLHLLLEASIRFEVRTTVNRALMSKESLFSLASYLSASGVQRYAIQEFRDVGCASAQMKEAGRLVLTAMEIDSLRNCFSNFEYRTA